MRDPMILLGELSIATGAVAEWINASIKRSNWQPIETCSEKDGRAFLVYCPELGNTWAVYRKEAFYGDAFMVWGGFERKLQETPTHWMPFPDPPIPQERAND